MQELNIKMELARDAWNAQSDVKIDSTQLFINLLSTNSELANWYSLWKELYSMERNMPASFQKFGVSKEQWKELSNKLPKYNEIMAKSSNDIAILSRDFDRNRQNIEEERDLKLNALKDPLLLIFRVGYAQLSLSDQILIQKSLKENREAKQKECIENLRFKLLQDLKNNMFVDPFVK
jgi:hypothetical protein